MSLGLLALITSPDAAVRDCSLDEVCAQASLDELLAECAALDAFRRTAQNLYERVRALFFLYAIHRFHLPQQMERGSPRGADAPSANVRRTPPSGEIGRAHV